ncbi:hypothetical protein PIB30_020594 [Stylosanthes scabra]|uniref:Amino acid transporter transmembrane domain-containing protein n=1 Tax=Stylosanthes scabra TaxID=79078 RepID=A0ABU6R8V2_9FABA|nr:hypothetical protein [Stylosanthes scabra]
MQEEKNRERETIREAMTETEVAALPLRLLEFAAVHATGKMVMMMPRCEKEEVVVVTVVVWRCATKMKKNGERRWRKQEEDVVHRAVGEKRGEKKPVAMPFFGDFVSICGAIGFTPLDFVFPALAYIKVGSKIKNNKNNKFYLLMLPLNVLIATWFSIVAILGCIGAIRFIVEDIKTYKFFHDM